MPANRETPAGEMPEKCVRRRSGRLKWDLGPKGSSKTGLPPAGL